jgi:Mrp family chromosome partitioning ATPase
MANFFQGSRYVDASDCYFASIGRDHLEISNSFTVHNTFAEERNSAAALAALKPVDRSGCYVSPCTPGTRQCVFEQIGSWLRDREAPNVLLLSGSPGVGKSTIAWTLASKLQTTGLLGSAFFCKRDNVTLSDPTTIWRTVAFDLARRDKHFADRVIENLKAGRVDPMRADIGMHFESLTKDPLAWVSRIYTEAQGRDVVEIHEWNLNGLTGVNPGQSIVMPYPVVILDALDECGSDSSQSPQRRSFLDTLMKWFDFHPMFKLVITSRDQDIPPAFRRACHCIILETGDLVSAQSNLDIQLFFEQRLAHITSRYPSLQLWPGEPIIKRLTDRAAGLFIWAETVVRFLDQGRGFPDEQLELVLDGNFHEEGNAIDRLYRQILHLSFKDFDVHVLHTFKMVMGAILLAKIPLSRHDLYHFLGRLKNSSIDFILDQVSSVISDWKCDRPIHINHLSFLEFMCDPKRCPETFFIDHQTHSQILALSCFQAVNTGLRFNICQIETSYLPNDALDLVPRIKQAIPSYLSYSCLFGAEHLHASAFDGDILHEVKTFMYTRFLFWLEVLSLLKEAKRATRALLLIREWSVSVLTNCQTKRFQIDTHVILDRSRHRHIFQGCKQVRHCVHDHHLTKCPSHLLVGPAVCAQTIQSITTVFTTIPADAIHRGWPSNRLACYSTYLASESS